MYNALRYLLVWIAIVLITVLIVALYERNLNPFTWDSGLLLATVANSLFILIFVIKAIIKANREETTN